MGNKVTIQTVAFLTGIVALLVGGVFAFLGAQHRVHVAEWRSLRLEQMETGLTFPLNYRHLKTIGPAVTSGWVHADTGGIKHLSQFSRNPLPSGRGRGVFLLSAAFFASRTNPRLVDSQS